MTSNTRSNQQLILQAMISIAFADGAIDADEMTTLRRLYEQHTGDAISVGDVEKASLFLQSSSDRPADALSAACAVMDMATKETLLRVSYMVLLADGRVSSRERKKLHEFAGALKIPEIHLTVILEELSEGD